MAYTYRNANNGDTVAFDTAQPDLLARGNWTLIADNYDPAAVAAVARLDAARAYNAQVAALIAEATAERAVADAGPAGPQGPAGPAGADGDDGAPGPAGPAGDPATNLVTSVAGRQGVVVLTKTDVGLGNVDNTSDAGKPVSTAQQAALDLKLNLAGGTLSGSVNTLRTLAASYAYTAAQTGDTQYRFAASGTGLLEWGSGSAVQDVNLYRSAADTLKTDDRFVIGRSGTYYSLLIQATDPLGGGVSVISGSTAGQILEGSVTGDGRDRIYIEAGGKIMWGDGTAVQDTNLYRSAADTLATDDRLRVLRNASSHALDITNPHASGDGLTVNLGTATRFALLAATTADAEYRLKVSVAGKFEWGNGTVIDTNLYRSAADTLKTDDSLHIGGNVGFYNTAPAAKPAITGSRAGNAALADLLTKLAGLGLLTDSTTA